MRISTSQKNDHIGLRFKNLLEYIMKFSKKNNYILFELLIILNIIIRLPMTSHEVGVDTFYVHALSTSISKFGVAGWTINPLSFFGLYPFSYPSAQPFILSGMSQSLDISLEHAILLMSICLGILGALSFYTLANEIFNSEVCAIVSSFLYSIAPIFLQYTYWQASSRNTILAVVPLIILIFIRCGKKIKYKYIALSLILLIFSLATHRATILLIVTIFAYAITFILSYILEKIKHLIPENANTHATYIILYVSSLLFFVQFTKLGFFDLSDYYTGALFNGEGSVIIVLNMLADYIGKYGIVLVMSIIGFIKLLKKENKNFGEMLILINLILLLPLMSLEDYSPLIVVPFALILTVIGILSIINIYTNHVKSKSGISIIIGTLMILSTVFSIFMIDHWNINKDVLSEETVSSANFIKNTSNGSVIANSGDLSSKITALTAVPTIPLGGPYAIVTPPNQIAFGFVNSEDISVRALNLSEIRPNTDELYVLTKLPNSSRDWFSIMTNNYWDDEAKNTLSKYDAHLLIKEGFSQEYHYWIWRPSQMLTSLEDSGNKIYGSGADNIYYIP